MFFLLLIRFSTRDLIKLNFFFHFTFFRLLHHLQHVLCFVNLLFNFFFVRLNFCLLYMASYVRYSYNKTIHDLCASKITWTCKVTEFFLSVGEVFATDSIQFASYFVVCCLFFCFQQCFIVALQIGTIFLINFFSSFIHHLEFISHFMYVCNRNNC